MVLLLAVAPQQDTMQYGSDHLSAAANKDTNDLTSIIIKRYIYTIPESPEVSAP